MDDIDPFEVPYQALWRIKHNGKDGLAFEWPEAPILLLLYCCASATEFEPVQQVAVAKAPADRAPVGWFFHMDRDEVKAVCTSIQPPDNAAKSSDWVSRVTGVLSERSMIFWEGDSEEDLVAFGALDPVVVSSAIPTAQQESGSLPVPSATLDKTVGNAGLVVDKKESCSLALPRKPDGMTSTAADAEREKERCSFDPFITFDQLVAEPVAASKEAEEKDEITYSSTSERSQGSEDMEIEWF